MGRGQERGGSPGTLWSGRYLDDPSKKASPLLRRKAQPSCKPCRSDTKKKKIIPSPKAGKWEKHNRQNLWMYVFCATSFISLWLPLFSSCGPPLILQSKIAETPQILSRQLFALQKESKISTTRFIWDEWFQAWKYQYNTDQRFSGLGIILNQCLFQPNLKHTVFFARPSRYNITSLTTAVRFMCAYPVVPKGWVPIH